MYLLHHITTHCHITSNVRTYADFQYRQIITSVSTYVNYHHICRVPSYSNKCHHICQVSAHLPSVTGCHPTTTLSVTLCSLYTPLVSLYLSHGMRLGRGGHVVSFVGCQLGHGILAQGRWVKWV